MLLIPDKRIKITDKQVICATNKGNGTHQKTKTSANIHRGFSNFAVPLGLEPRLF